MLSFANYSPMSFTRSRYNLAYIAQPIPLQILPPKWLLIWS